VEFEADSPTASFDAHQEERGDLAGRIRAFEPRAARATGG
jgi:hypothetical protein